MSPSDQGLARDQAEVDVISDRLTILDHHTQRQDLAWQVGLNAQMISFKRRTIEIENFLRAAEVGQL